MQEARISVRTRTMLGAQVIFQNRNSTIDCTVRNLSASGARLELTDSVAAPSEFELIVPHKSRSYRARICWRGEDSVGVTFLGEATSDLTEKGASRIVELENENAKLRIKLGKLSQELTRLQAPPEAWAA